MAGAGEGYDAIVLDIVLPGLNGHRVCRRLRADGNGATAAGRARAACRQDTVAAARVAVRLVRVLP